MGYNDVPIILFIMILILFGIWFSLLRKYKLVKSVFFLYYAFNFLLFCGPLVYYKLGYTGYSSAISYNSMFIFQWVVLVIILLNIFFTYFIIRNNKKILYSTFYKLSFDNIHNKRLVKHFYIVIYLISILYIIIYRKYFPISKLIEEGELGERLDKTGAIPFYITMSAIFMVFIPSGFLYFRNLTKSKILKFLLMLFTLFCLSAGGNKGIISFFLIFYVLLVNKKQSFFKYILLVGVLAFIYVVFKGVTEFNAQTIDYLVESPFRRLFAAQGSGFITRIEMMLNNEFVEGWEIKKQVYAKIYSTNIGDGSSPTHFLGDLILKYGYFISFLIYLIYLSLMTRLLYTIGIVYRNDTKSTFILWNFFLISYLTVNSDISLANLIRFVLIFMNLYIVYYVSRVKRQI